MAILLGYRATPAGAVLNSYVYWGLNSSVNCSVFQNDPQFGKYWIPGYASCWHKDEGTTDPFGAPAYYSAIDYTKLVGQTAGTLTQLWYTGANLAPAFRTLPAASGTCTGVRVDTYKSGGVYMGDLHYLHIDVYAGVVGSFSQSYNPQDGHFWRDLGTVSSSQPTGCTTTGPHMHQSANVASWTLIFSNVSVNPTTTWEHRITQ